MTVQQCFSEEAALARLDESRLYDFAGDPGMVPIQLLPEEILGLKDEGREHRVALNLIRASSSHCQLRHLVWAARCMPDLLHLAVSESRGGPLSVTEQ